MCTLARMMENCCPLIIIETISKYLKNFSFNELRDIIAFLTRNSFFGKEKNLAVRQFLFY